MADDDHDAPVSSLLYADSLRELPSPRDFFDTYIKQRRPVLLQGCAASVNPKLAAIMATTTTTSLALDQLLEIVGSSTTVEVNQKHTHSNKMLSSSSSSSSFSPKHSHVITMTFSDLVHALKSGSDQYYMTTQSLPLDDEGRPLLYTTPVTQLIKAGIITDLRPLGITLIPMTYNLWMGTSSSSCTSSSGLHHDYHDNLYCLVEGRKTFHIAPPQCVRTFKMKGTLHTLHDNGRIVYHEQVQERGGGGMIRPDGALVKVERIMQLEIRKQKIEERMEINNNNNDDDDNNHNSSRSPNEQQQLLLEKELNAIEEELLDLEMMDEKDNNHDNHNKGVSSPSLLLFGGIVANTNSDDDDDDDDDCNDTATDSNQSDDNDDSSISPPNAKKQRVVMEKNDDDDDTDEDETTATVPLNFVMDDDDDNNNEDNHHGIHFQTIEMVKGDMLYLPAGWFHNVISSGGGEHDLHVAFNYWMHPPDTGTCWEAPYVSQFWQRDWESRRCCCSEGGIL